MTLTDENEILAVFRKLAKEFEAVDDSEVLDSIAFYSEMISSPIYGRFYSRAIALLVAHQMKSAELAANGENLATGDVVMEKEGDLQRQYAAREAGSASDSWYNKTSYGVQFLALRRMIIATVRI